MSPSGDLKGSDLDEGVASVFPSELTYGPGADYGYSSLSCDVEDDLGNDCLAWSSGHVIQRQRLPNPVSRAWSWADYVLLETEIDKNIKNTWSKEKQQEDGSCSAGIQDFHDHMLDPRKGEYDFVPVQFNWIASLNPRQEKRLVTDVHLGST